MSKKLGMIENREMSSSLIKDIFKVEVGKVPTVTADAIAESGIVNKLGIITQAEKVINEATFTTTVDGVDENIDFGEPYSFADDIASMVQSRKMGVSADAIDSALTVVAQAMSDATVTRKLGVTVDGVMNIRAADLVVQIAKMNFINIINSNIPDVVGEIGDLAEDTISSPIGGGTSYKIFEITDIITKGQGGLATDTELDTKNMFTPVTTLCREKTEKIVDGTLTYTFDVKAKTGDANNFPLRVGHQEVIFAGTGVSFGDVSAESKNVDFSTIKTYKNKKITFEAKHTDGKIVITLEDAATSTLLAGTNILFRASLNSKETSKTRALFGSDVSSKSYVAELVNMGTTINVIDDLEIKKNIKVALLPRGMRLAEQKRTAEIIGRSIGYFTLLATKGGDIDISSDTYSTRAEQYKGVTNLISQVSKTIASDTVIAGAGRLSVFGGKDLITTMNLSSEKGQGTVATDANGFQYLGLLADTYPAYYHPMYDDDNPKTDKDGVVSATASDNVYFSITVVGKPLDPARRIVLKGMPVPLQPVDTVGVDNDLNMEVPIIGQQVLSINKSERSQKLARKIYIKA